MTLTTKQLINLPVFTESGQKIGKVFVLEVDEKNHVIEKYVVKTNNFFKFAPTTLLLSPRQIVRINEKDMIVTDATIRILEKKQIKKNSPLEDPSAVVYIQPEN